jgi:hypothetical protein
MDKKPEAGHRLLSRMAKAILAPNVSSTYTEERALIDARSILTALVAELERRGANRSNFPPDKVESTAELAARMYAEQTPKSDRTRDINSAVVAALDSQRER